MSDSDMPHGSAGPSGKDLANDSDALTGSDAKGGKRSRSQSRRAQRRRQNERRKGNMPAVGEEREEEETNPSVQQGKQNLERRPGTTPNLSETGAGKQSTRGNNEESDGEIAKKEGLKLRLELDLNVELELKAKIKGSVTLSLL